MPEESDVQKAVQDTVTDARTWQKNVDHLPFSPDGFSVLQDEIAVYIRDLVGESYKISDRQKADTISAAHVQRAAEYLVTTTRKRLSRHFGTIGGILLGASVSALLTMAAGSQASIPATLLSAAIAVVGSFMVALHMAKE